MPTRIFTNSVLLLIASSTLAACAGDSNDDRPSQYQIEVNSTAGGTITPDGVITVTEGNTLEFTITPSTNYEVLDVSGCGGSLVGNLYSTAAINSDCTISASFKLIDIDVTATAGTNGDISPAGITPVPYGNTAEFTLLPDPGYKIETAGGCGGSLTDNIYTTGAITTECTVDVTFIPIPAGERKWRFDGEASSTIYTAPALATDGVLFFSSWGNDGTGNVYAISTLDGSEIWHFENDENFSASPAIGTDGTVYVGSESGVLYALNPSTGEELWHFDTASIILASVAINDDGTLYLAADKVYALDPADGSEIWSFALDTVSPPLLLFQLTGQLFMSAIETTLFMP